LDDGTWWEDWPRRSLLRLCSHQFALAPFLKHRLQQLSQSLQMPLGKVANPAELVDACRVAETACRCQTDAFKVLEGVEDSLARIQIETQEEDHVKYVQ
jgi:hypothetical protein